MATKIEKNLNLKNLKNNLLNNINNIINNYSYNNNYFDKNNYNLNIYDFLNFEKYNYYYNLILNSKNYHQIIKLYNILNNIIIEALELLISNTKY